MKKRLMAVVFTITVLFVGCGKEVETVNNTGQSSEKVSSIIENMGDTDTETVERTEDEIKHALENNKDALNLTEYENVFEDRNIDESGDLVILLGNFKDADVNRYYLTDSVDLYIDNGKCIGYTKPNVEVSVISEGDGWYLINVDGKDRYAKIDDIKAVGYAGSKSEYLASQKEDSQKTESIEVSAQAESTASSSVLNEVVTEIPVAEAPAPAESDKYTPDEAIAVYRSLMEAGGITWDPSLKGVTSWGTGWIYLDKGMPEWTASTDLESFAMGDSGGHSWTKYYLEVTGSDENAVYITAWHA